MLFALANPFTGRRDPGSDLLNLITEVEADHLRKIRSPRSPILEKGKDYITLTMSPEGSPSASLTSTKSKEKEDYGRGRNIERKHQFANPLARSESRPRRNASTPDYQQNLEFYFSIQRGIHEDCNRRTLMVKNRMLLFKSTLPQSNDLKLVAAIHFMMILLIHAELWMTISWSHVLMSTYEIVSLKS